MLRKQLTTEGLESDCTWSEYQTKTHQLAAGCGNQQWGFHPKATQHYKHSVPEGVKSISRMSDQAKCRHRQVGNCLSGQRSSLKLCHCKVRIVPCGAIHASGQDGSIPCMSMNAGPEWEDAGLTAKTSSPLGGSASSAESLGSMSQEPAGWKPGQQCLALNESRIRMRRPLCLEQTSIVNGGYGTTWKVHQQIGMPSH